MPTLKETAPGCAHLNDREFVAAFENCTLRSEWFHHPDHIRLAWLYLKQYDYKTAERCFRDGLIRLAAHFGVSEKFHVTVTLAWMRVVAAHMRPGESLSFEGWVPHHQELLDSRFLLAYYSEDRLKASEARENWIEPDLQALPLTGPF